MTNLHHSAPIVQPGRELTLLRAMLAALGYTPSAAEEIVSYTAAEGTIEGAPGLDPVDYEDAEGALETGFPVVPFTSYDWGSATGDESPHRAEDDCWTPNDTVALDPPDLDLEEWESDRAEQPEPDPLSDPNHASYPPAPEGGWEPDSAVPVPVPAIAGGAPCQYQPTEEDWADYRAWTEAVEARDEARRLTDGRNPLYGYE